MKKQPKKPLQLLNYKYMFNKLKTVFDTLTDNIPYSINNKLLLDFLSNHRLDLFIERLYDHTSLSHTETLRNLFKILACLLLNIQSNVIDC